jgi:hypothetical protein
MCSGVKTQKSQGTRKGQGPGPKGRCGASFKASRGLAESLRSSARTGSSVYPSFEGFRCSYPVKRGSDEALETQPHHRAAARPFIIWLLRRKLTMPDLIGLSRAEVPDALDDVFGEDFQWSRGSKVPRARSLIRNQNPEHPLPQTPKSRSQLATGRVQVVIAKRTPRSCAKPSRSGLRH